MCSPSDFPPYDAAPPPRSSHPFRYRVSFAVRDLPGVLDMLRTDGATVTNWDREAHITTGERYVIHLASDRYPTVLRWRSFGLYPRDDATGEPVPAL